MQTDEIGEAMGSRATASKKIFQALLYGRCVRVIGHRFMGKSDILREAAALVKRDFSPFVSYQSMAAFKPEGWGDFYTRIYRRVEQDLLMADRVGEERACPSPLDLQYRMLELVEKCDRNLIIFIDDLEVAPPNLIASLLGIIRAVFNTSLRGRGARFQAVVCGSLSFNQLALPYVSRFESISEMVFIGDLDVAESQRLVTRYCADLGLAEDVEGVRRLLDFTGGDRYLIRSLLHLARETIDGRDAPELLPETVEQAVKVFLARAMEMGTGEAIRQIEADPSLLSCTLMILQQGRVRQRFLPLDSMGTTNLLDLNSVFRKEGDTYQVKSRLWERILRERLSDARVGRLYALAGRWSEAVQYLGRAMAAQQAEVKLDLFSATLNAMHDSANGEEAFAKLAQGLLAVYLDSPFRLYHRTAASLKQIYPLSEDGQAREIRMSESGQAEIEALKGPDYSAIFDAQGTRFLFPLRLREDSEPMGMVSFGENFQRFLYEGYQEEIYQLISFLRQATRAIEARDTYAHTLMDAEKRAEKQKNLNDILTHILYDHALPYETMLRLVMAGVTSGLCLEFNRAVLLLQDEQSKVLTAQMGVGHLSWQEADEDWRHIPFDNLNELIEALLVPDYHYTQVHTQVQGITIPADRPDGSLLVSALESQEAKVSRRGLSLEGLPEVLTQAIGTTELFALVPFKAGPQMTGVLYVDNRFTRREINEERLFLLKNFMNQAALVMELSRALVAEQHRGFFLEHLLKAEEAINDQITRQVQGVLEQITERAQKLFEARCTVLYTLKRQFEDGRPVYVTDQIVYAGTEQDHSRDRMPRSDRGITRFVVEQGLAYISDVFQDGSDALLEEVRGSRFVRAEKIRSSFGVRLGTAEEPLGVLYLNWDRPNPLTREEKAFIPIFAGFAAVAVPSARRHQQVQDDLLYHTREMEGLRQLLQAGTKLWSEGEIEEVVRQSLITTRDLTDILELKLVRRGANSCFLEYRLNSAGEVVKRDLDLPARWQNSPQTEDARLVQVFTQANPAEDVWLLEGELFWPIHVGGNLLGGMLLPTSKPGQIQDKHSDYLNHLCNRLALTFHQSQVYQALNKLLDAALRLTQDIPQADFLDQFLKQLVEEARNSLWAVDMITSYYMDTAHDTPGLKLGPTAGLWYPESLGTVPADYSDVVMQVLHSDQPILAERVWENPALNGPFVDREGVRSAAAFPLRVGERRVGSIFFSYRHFQKFDPGERGLLHLFAQLAAIAVNHARLLAEAQRQKERLETVARITDKLAESGPDLKTMYDHLFREVMKAIPLADNACLVQKDTDGQEYFIVLESLKFYRAQLQPGQDTFRIGRALPNGIVIRVIEQGQAVLANDARQDPDYFPAIVETQSELCVPVELDGKPHAALLLESNSRDAFTKDDELLLTALAPVVSIAIQRVQQMLRAKEREELEKMGDFAVLLVHEITGAVANIPDLIQELRVELVQQGKLDEECVADLLINSDQARQLSTYVRDMSQVS